MAVAANAQAGVPAIVRAADNEAVGWMWVPTTAPPLQLSGGPAVGSSNGLAPTAEPAGAAASASSASASASSASSASAGAAGAAGAAHARRAQHPLITLLQRHRSEVLVAAAAAALAPGVPPLLAALAARSASAGAAATWGTNLVSQTVTVQRVLRAPGARRALALVAKLQAPARRWAAVAAVAGAQGLRKLLPRLRPAAASRAAPAAADTLRYTLRAVQTAGTLVLGLAGGKLWSQ